MEEEILEAIKDERNKLAHEIETSIRNFTDKTNYLVEKIRVEYKNSNSGDADGGAELREPSVRISIRLAIDNYETAKLAVGNLNEEKG